MTRESATAAEATAADATAAEATARRSALLREHAEQRRRRDEAPLGSEEYRSAAMRISAIEVEIARIERAAGVG